MIVNYDFTKRKNNFSDFKKKDLKLRLADLQIQCKLRNIPVIIIIEGFETSGRGTAISEITERLDTKTFTVKVFDSSEEDYIFTRPFWENIPAKGEFAIYNKSNYHQLFWALEEDDQLLDKKISFLLQSEKALMDDDTLIIKYFVNVSKETQRKRIERLAYGKYMDFMVSDLDVYQSLYYDRYASHMDRILKKTSTQDAPWHILNGEDIEEAINYILGTSSDLIEKKLASLGPKQYDRSYKATKLLEKVNIDKTVGENVYESVMPSLQIEARNLAYELYYNRIPSVIVFEGVDAAGKGGAIRRLTRYIDARQYQVNPTSAPSDAEKDHHYLWRFFNNLPRLGGMDIFDRSWYGRLMVERVEGFATEEEWNRAYDEINQMEYELVDSGVMVLKLFIAIDKDEQLKRFKYRELNKPYKLTDEDWRNREKWDENIEAMNEMLDRTSTDYAPWKIIPGNQKEYARIKVLKSFIKKAKESLGYK